jgi:SAM-dependent methyltransferase
MAPGWTRAQVSGYLGRVREARLAAMIEDLTRRLTAAAPAPRGLPYLGLERPSGSGVQLLEALSTHGIFRKYELVLDLGGGLGPTARWLAGRLGCTAVVTTPDADAAAAGHTLTRRAALHGRVQHVCAEAETLPFGDARFTHVWVVETLPQIRDVAAALAEARRVVRPGGHLAMQELVAPDVGAAPVLDGWLFATLDARRDALHDAGFVDLDMRPVPEAGERSARVVAARVRLHARLEATSDGALRGVARERAALAAALGEGRLRLVQLVARRP